MKRFIRKHGKKLLLVLILLIAIGSISYFIINKKSKVHDGLNLGIVDYKQYDYPMGQIVSHYLLASDGQKSKVIDLESSFESDYICQNKDYVDMADGYIVKRNNKDWVLVNYEGKELLKSNSYIAILKDEVSKKIYFNTNEKGKNILYDETFNIVYNDSVIHISNNILYTNDKKYNLQNKTTEDISSVGYYGDYITYLKNNKYYALSTKENLEYGPFDDNKNGILVNSEQYLSLNGLNIFWNEEKMLTSFWKADKDTCKNGTKLKNKKGEVILSDCSYGYDLSYEDKGFIITLDEDGDYSNIVFNNGEVRKSRRLEVVGDYIITGGQYLNLKGEVIEKLKCDHLVYVNNDTYICEEKNTSYFLDKDLKEISPHYDYLDCNDLNICKIGIDGKYGLSIGSEKIVDPTYGDVLVYDNKAIIQDLSTMLVIDFDYTNKPLEFKDIKKNFKFDKYNEINTSEVIEKYNLNDYDKLIKENENLFKKYTYIAQKNDGIGKYLPYVIKLFPVIANNKEYLDEDYFLRALYKLFFYQNDNKVDGNAGIYHDDTKSIELKVVSDSVIYHEILHFIDFNFNNQNNKENNTLNLYKKGNEIITESSYYDKSPEEQANYYFTSKTYRFISEAGAELYSLDYFENGNKPRVYLAIIYIYNALRLIYGDDFMKEVFFKDNGIDLLYQKIVDGGYVPSECLKMFDFFDSYREESFGFRNEDIQNVFDYLVTLYENENNKKWYQDKAFNLFISLLIYNNENLLINSKYYKDLEEKIDIADFINEKAAGSNSEFRNVNPNYYINIVDNYLYANFDADYYRDGNLCGSFSTNMKYNIEKDIVETDYNSILCGN